MIKQTIPAGTNYKVKHKRHAHLGGKHNEIFKWKGDITVETKVMYSGTTRFYPPPPR